MRNYLLLILIFIAASTARAQQVADTLFNPAIENPAYQLGAGPRILIDEAHNNFHTKDGKYLPFARILTRDGYHVEAYNKPFLNEDLKTGKILVIANALHSSNKDRWSLPTPSAFTDEEISEIHKWVSEGGAMLLIADHMPFPGASEKLASAFGIEFINGFAVKNDGKDIFTPGKGLVQCSITRGRNEGEVVTSVETFMGQGFRIPEGAQPILTLGPSYKIRMPETAWQFSKSTPSISGNGLVQGACMKVGKGRVVVFGEAAMFTAQRQGKSEFGMNSKSAAQNLQLLLNVIHWLDGVLE
jgi:hypothetical protein